MNLLEVAEKWGSVAKIAKEEIFDRSKDGKTVVLLDGTKVSDELIAQAKQEAKARAAAAAAAESAGAQLIDDPDFVAKVTTIAEDAARKVLNQAKK